MTTIVQGKEEKTSQKEEASQMLRRAEFTHCFGLNFKCILLSME